MNMTRADLAWMKGEACYETGDTPEAGVKKAEEHGYKCPSDARTAFLSGFLNMVNTNLSTAP